MTDNALNEEKIREAYSKQIEIHLTLKDNTWRNGFVKEIHPDFFVFWDLMDKEDEPIFFMELHDVNPRMWKKKEEKEDDRGK